MTYTFSVDGKETVCDIEDTKINVKYSNEEIVSTEAADIIGVEEIKSKDGNITKFNIHYIDKSKNPKWRKSSIKCSGDRDVYNRFIQSVNGLMEKFSSRPKRLLVMINPVGGRQTGVKSYNSIVAPLFKLANITTEVIVSERAKHIIEVMESYDISQVDGIVLCGGDGTYHECVTTLLKRFQVEAGIDINDKDSTIMPLRIPMGIIPTGTGNVLARGNYGCLDIETAALHIIRGSTKKRCMTGYYDQGKLLGYAGQSFSYGIFTDMMHSMNTSRWLKSVKKIVIPFYHTMIKRFRQFSAEITLFTSNKNDPQSTDVLDTDTSSDKRSGENQSSSVTIRGSFIEVCVLVDDMTDEEFRLHGKLVDTDRTTLSLYKLCSHLQLTKHFFRLLNEDPDGFLFDYLQNYKITGFKFKLLNETSSATDQSSSNILERLLGLDGEIVEIPRAEFECRWQKDVVPVFSSTW